VLLETVIADVQASELDTEPRARILLKAIEVGLKIVEVTDLEQRLTALERAASGDLRDENERMRYNATIKKTSSP
jgi:hypothetical protein